MIVLGKCFAVLVGIGFVLLIVGGALHSIWISPIKWGLLFYVPMYAAVLWGENNALR
jgi:hypothetical protein